VFPPFLALPKMPTIFMAYLRYFYWGKDERTPRSRESITKSETPANVRLCCSDPQILLQYFQQLIF